ncbi:MAG: DNRLRE domain-containing protein, partial [Actinomycetota bacterium]|nr:DNRLRE domain-containing protein [Actinomycetota bacterium]
TLSAESFSWSIRLFHNEHSHPFLTFDDIDAGSFQLPNPLDEVSPNQFYRITLTVTDSAGARHSPFVDVTPVLSTVTLTTNVPGLKLTLDGQSVVDGHAYTGVENALRTIGAPSVQSLNGTFYQFDSWSDGGAASHDVNTPTDDATFTATYVELPVPEAATLTPAGDGYVRDGSFGNTNYGESIDLLIKRSTTVGNTREGYLTFDTSGVAPGGTAKLRLFGQLGNLAGTIKPVPVGVYAVADTSWGEETLTHNTRPTAGALLKTTSVLTGAGQWYEWDVTDYVNAEKVAGRNVVSFALRATAATDPFAMFNSDEAANRPELVLAPKPPSQDVPLAPVVDGFVRNGTFGGTNYGNDGMLLVKKSGTTGNTRESYLRFDLSAIGTITTAKLRLWGFLTNVTDGGTPHVQIYKSTNTTWSETGLTWNNKPASTGSALATTTITGTGGAWFEWNLTSFLQAEKAAGRNVVTLVLQSSNTTNPMATFNSDEAAANRPELLVTT